MAKIQIRGDEGAQEIAERDVDGRTIIEGARASDEELLGGPAGFRGQPVRQRPGKVGRIVLAAAGTVDAEQVRGAPGVNREIGVKDRGDQDRAAIVRLGFDFDVMGVRLGAERAAQAGAHAGGFAELLRQLDQRIRRGYLRLNFGLRCAFCFRFRFELRLKKLAAGLLQRVEQCVLVGEMREQRREVGKGLVKGRHVDIGRLREELADAVNDGVRGFVRDDVV